MPWDDTADWAWLGAAKHTLGLLLAGEAPGPRLFRPADYLLAFPPSHSVLRLPWTRC